MHTADVVEVIEAAGGFATRRQLRRAGATDRDLTRAVRSGDLHRPRLGWYTNLPRNDARVVAVSVGGRLTGGSALFELGAWMWERPPLVTVSVPPHASRLRHRRATRVVYDDGDVRSRGGVALVDVRDALVRAVLEESFEIAIALLDWALHGGRITSRDLREIAARLPADARGVVDWVDASSESILESVVRVRLRQAGFHVTSQVPNGFGERTDLVVEGVLGIETDGRRWHAQRFDRDAVKDLRGYVAGRIPMHLSYAVVRHDWGQVLAAVEAAVALHRLGGRRRRPPRDGSRPVPPSARGTRRRAWRLPRRPSPPAAARRGRRSGPGRQPSPDRLTRPAPPAPEPTPELRGRPDATRPGRAGTAASP